jgi:hypothetical protein
LARTATSGIVFSNLQSPKTGLKKAARILAIPCRVLLPLSDIQYRDPSTIEAEVILMNHLTQRKEASEGSTRAFVTQVPKAAAMLLFGTPPRPTDPELTLMEDSLCCAEAKVSGVSIMLIEL